MPDLQPTASEVVFVHALRFVEPAPLGVLVPGHTTRVDGRALARVLLAAAVASAQSERWIDLAFAERPWLLGLVRRRDLTALPGDRADFVPASTLEAKLVGAVATGSSVHGCDLDWAIRHGLASPGGNRPDPIAIVRDLAGDRGVLLPGDRPLDHPALGPEAADRVHSLLADLRERDPGLWRSIHDSIAAAFVPWIPARVRSLAPRILRPRRRREAKQHDLHGWERLNRNPPRAT